MGRFIRRLRKLCKKKEKSDIAKRLRIVDDQLFYISRLEKEEEIEKRFVRKLIDKIKRLEAYKEFNISKDEFYRILKEKNIEENFYHLFLSEINEFKKKILELRKLLEEQKRQKGSASGSLVDEWKRYSELESLFEKINYSESRIKRYFEEMNQLRYNKKYIRSGQIIGKVIKNVLFKVEVEGIENIPKKGPCILAPYHYHASYDPLILMGIINRKLFFSASVKAFTDRPYMEGLYHAMGCFPIKRDYSLFKGTMPKREREYPNPNKASIMKMVRLLRYGEAVVIFPEGEAKVGNVSAFAQHTEFLEPQCGFVMLVYLVKKQFNIDVPVIPIGFNYKAGIRKVRVRIGNPVHLNLRFQGMDKKEIKRMISRYTYQIFYTIRRLSH